MTFQYASANNLNSTNLRSNLNRLVRVLVVGGGGSAGGGAGGVRTGGGGGGGGVIDDSVIVTFGLAYTVRVGAGASSGSVGNWSRFGDLTAAGGGTNIGSTYFPMATGPGSLGARNISLFLHQGNSGGIGITVSGLIHASGGGGASGLGGDSTVSAGGAGGSGRLSTIPITETYYGGGGGGGQNNNSASPATAGSGGIGGGGNGGTTGAGSAGTANTGGGGGGGSSPANGLGGLGGSGIVVLRFSSALNITIGAGLTFTVAFDATNGDEVVRFTGGTGTVSFS